MHPQISTAAPPSPRAEHQTLPMVAAVSVGVGLIGFFARTSAAARLPARASASSRQAMALLAGCLLCGLLCAGPVAARDDGPTIPIESILAERQPEGGRAQLVSDMVAAYPVATPGLRQAVLRRATSLPQAYANWLTQPVALIADDEVSRRWLTQQGDALRTLGASILVVRVHSEQRMRSLRAHRADLAMAPAFVPELVGALREVHAAVYPLVILSDGSVQQDVRDLVNEVPQSGREFP